VLGYATLAAGIVARRDLTKALGHGFPDTIPVTLLARLALRRDLQHQKLGGVLLAEALGIAARSAVHVAAAFVVVDALHERAAEFYMHHGFSRLPETNRLALKMATIAAA
jgi:GNAT superfamily N-acetyltransferase